MPANYRRRMPPPPQLSPPGAEFSDSEEDFADQDVGEAEGEIEDLEEDLEQDEDEDEVEDDAVGKFILDGQVICLAILSSLFIPYLEYFSIFVLLSSPPCLHRP